MHVHHFSWTAAFYFVLSSQLLLHIRWDKEVEMRRDLGLRTENAAGIADKWRQQEGNQIQYNGVIDSITAG